MACQCGPHDWQKVAEARHIFPQLHFQGCAMLRAPGMNWSCSLSTCAGRLLCEWCLLSSAHARRIWRPKRPSLRRRAIRRSTRASVLCLRTLRCQAGSKAGGLVAAAWRAAANPDDQQQQPAETHKPLKPRIHPQIQCYQCSPEKTNI